MLLIFINFSHILVLILLLLITFIPAQYKFSHSFGNGMWLGAVLVHLDGGHKLQIIRK